MTFTHSQPKKFYRSEFEKIIVRGITKVKALNQCQKASNEQYIHANDSVPAICSINIDE